MNLKLAHEWQDFELLLRTLRETARGPRGRGLTSAALV